MVQNLLPDVVEEPPEIESDSLPAEDSKTGGIDALSGYLERKAKLKPRGLQMAAYLRTIPAGLNSEVARVQELVSAVVDQDGNPDIRAQKRLTRKHLPEWFKAARAAEKLERCGQWLHFRHYYTIDDVRLLEGNFCSQTKLCPDCAAGRGARNVSAYLQRYNYLRQEHLDLTAYMVTLTVKNGPDLLERFTHLEKNFNKLIFARRQVLAGNGRGKTEFSKIQGGVFSTELTVNADTREYHVHKHGVVLCSSPIDKYELSAEWKRRTGDSFIIDVRPLLVEDGQDVKSFCEVFKYALKFQDMQLADNWRAHLDLQGRRLVKSFGLFFGVKVPELNDEPLEEDLPYIDLWYRYLAAAGSYSLVSDTQNEAPCSCAGRKAGSL